MRSIASNRIRKKPREPLSTVLHGLSLPFDRKEWQFVFMEKNKKRVAKKKTCKSNRYLPNRNRTIPWGRTLSTYDHYIGKSKTKSTKKRPVVVIETNERNELAVVPLSSRDGKNRTRLAKYQDGKSYYKHFVEIEDNAGNPIKVGDKFRENHPNNDVSSSDVIKIRDKVFNHAKTSGANCKKMEQFRKK